jgi:hypothetical protein
MMLCNKYKLRDCILHLNDVMRQGTHRVFEYEGGICYATLNVRVR